MVEGGTWIGLKNQQIFQIISTKSKVTGKGLKLVNFRFVHPQFSGACEGVSVILF